MEVGYPWLTYGAILAIEGQIKSDHKVLEFGSGGSTIFFSKRCHLVRSYEMRPRWISHVKDFLPDNSNVSFVYGDHIAMIKSVKDEPDNYYDWVLADIDPSYELRFRLMNEAIPKLKRHRLLIIDNYNEERMRQFDYTGWDVHTFDDFGYGSKGTRICIKQ